MILGNLRLATCDPGDPVLRDHAAVVLQGDRIAWAGAESALPDRFADLPREECGGRLATPGLIDCHTHIVHAGNRAAEFEARLDGASYEDIARAGGGILSTVAATRAADEDALVAQALPRLDRLIAEGVTTIEVKSGYGLDIETEMRMLRAARRLGDLRPVRVMTSWLAAHAIPPGAQAEDYIDRVAITGLRAAQAQGLVDAVDGFCETIAFTPSQIARLFVVAQSLGLPVKLHAEQLSHQGGATLAARHGALSADHLEHATEADAMAMAAAGTVAVLLPGAFYTLRETQVPPVAAFRTHAVPMALATDCNPGSSPLNSLLTAMNMGCVLFRLTVAEALAGVTRHAARALGQDELGRIAPGCRADLCLWDADSPADLCGRIGANPLFRRYFNGVPC